MKIKLTFLILFLLIAANGCNAYNHHKERSKEKRNSNLASILSFALKDLPTADCIYCDNTRSMNGNCTCFTSVPVTRCTGMNVGQGKSNSYKISCSNLISTGVWANQNETTFYCNYTTCPPEAYRAAFTADGR